MHVMKGFCILPVVIDFLLLLWVTYECFLNLLEIFGRWVLLARDKGPADQLCNISVELVKLGPMSVCCSLISAWGTGILQA